MKEGVAQVAIVGGGVAGLSLARALAGRRRVVLFEADHWGAGASGAPVALLNPYRGRSARASDLDLAGLAEMRALHARLRAGGHDTGAHFGGVLRLATSARQARQWQARTAGDAGARWLAPAEVPPQYHAPFGGFLALGGGWLEPARWLSALADAARAQGAELREGARVTGLAYRGPLWALLTADGEVLAERAILCLGADQLPGTPFAELERARGDVVTLSPAPALPYPLAGAVYGVPLARGFAAGGNHRDPDALDADAPARVAAGAAHFVPALQGAANVAHWTGVRASRADNRPLAAELEPGLWALGALSGRGFLAAALLARQLAERLAPT